MARFLYIVARERMDLYERFREEFGREADIEIVLDRRRDLAQELREVGYFIRPNPKIERESNRG
jgi:hypothetical protein